MTLGNTWPDVAVVGPGGVGAYFGGMLARAGAKVTMLGRPGPSSEHLDTIARRGLRLDTQSFDERVGVETTVEPRSIAGAELVLFCVKSVDTTEAARRIAPHLSSDAILLDLQNGVDNPDKLRALGLDPIPAVVYVAAAVEVPGEVKHRGRGDLVIGHASRRSDVERAADWLVRAGIPCVVSDDVERDLWVKLILNSMANATSALTGASYGQLAEFDPTWQIAIDVATEAVAVARAEGHDLERDEVIRRGLEVCRAVGSATSSTQQDIANGRPTEVDALNGIIATLGAKHGLPTPVNHTLWALVKLREAGNH
jgi:2-dehydropantoate 2-reductase